MKWTLTGADNFSAIIADGKARVEQIAACPDCQRNHFELMADIRRILARAKPLN
ncbi:MAG: hypothetical protein ACREAM_28585 [Blastocatellia bacterium]